MLNCVKALVIVALLAPAASAVPVNPADPQGVAAVMPLDPVNSQGLLHVLTTSGEVWYFGGGSWSRVSPYGFGIGELDLPVPVTEVVDWWLWGFRTNEGAWWVYVTSVPQHWEQVGPPPFAPTPIAPRSLGGVKRTYR